MKSNPPAVLAWPEQTVSLSEASVQLAGVWDATMQLKRKGLLCRTDFCSINAAEYKCKG